MVLPITCYISKKKKNSWWTLWTIADNAKAMKMEAASDDHIFPAVSSMKSVTEKL